MNGQQLKNSILQMAVQGKLVPQDPNDEPASVLIKRIRAEKDKLIKEKKIKKEKNPSYIYRGSDNLHYEKIGDAEPVCIEDQIPFEIPNSWEWMRLGDLFYLIMGQSPKGESVAEYGGGIEFHQGKVYFSEKYLKPSTQVTNEPSKIAPANSVLLCVRAPVGKVNITEREICIGRGLCSIIPVGNMLLDLVYYFLLNYENLLTKQATGTTFIAVTGEVVKNQLFPVPPIQEQTRIVDKINELLPYIKEYDAKESQINTLSNTFPNQLKKSILQEAVQGKLVPQDPSDEPASVLLDRIREEKARLVKEGKIKKDKNESLIFRRDNSYYEKSNGVERCIDEEIPFDIPDSWSWCRLSFILTKLSDGTHFTPKYVSSGVPFLSVKDISAGKIDFANCKYISENEHKELYKRCDPEFGDILLTKVGTTGIPVIVDTEKQFSLFVSVALLKFNRNYVFNKYLLYAILSPLVQSQAEDNTRGVGNKNWVIRDIARTLLPLPPLAEQQRIVAKIEQLIAKINDL